MSRGGLLSVRVVAASPCAVAAGRPRAGGRPRRGGGREESCGAAAVPEGHGAVVGGGDGGGAGRSDAFRVTFK